MKKPSLLILSGLWILASGFSTAQTQEELNSQLHLQAQPNFERLPTGEKMFSWIGQSGFSYFIQASPDLLDWTWAPNIEPGVDAPMSYEVDGPNAAGFFRLIRTDQTATDLDAADFDNDGLSNNFELTPRPRPGGIIGFSSLNPNIQTHPLRADTDGDGLSDKWELENGFDPTDNGTRLIDNGPNGDPDNDGVTNLNEQRLGTQPKGNATSTDSDGDGTLDFEDAVPGDNLVSWKRTPESSYALIEIETPSNEPSPQDLNDKGEVLFSDGIWSGGNWLPRTAEDGTGAAPVEDGASYTAHYEGWSRFNHDRKLIGTAHLTFTDGPAAGGDGIGSPAFWVQGQSSPSLLLDTAELWENVPNHSSPIGVTTDGSMVHLISPQPGTTSYLGRYSPTGSLVGQMTGSGGFHPSAQWHHADVTGTGWVTSNLTRPASPGQSAAHKVGLWDTSNYPIALPAEADGWGYPVRAKDLPNGKVVLTAGATNGTTTTGRVFLPNPTGQYEYATKLADKNIELFAGDGSALTSDNKLWRNGDLIPMAELCPRYKELIEAGNTIHPLRSNKDGTYLVQVQPPTATTTAALAVPVKVEWKALTGFDNVDDHEDPWTHARNGKRIFPDYKDPNDTEIRNKLELVVTVSPAMAGQSIFVKAFDVDDSTAETFDTDIFGAAVIDTKGKAGDDNLIDYLGTTKSGQFWTGSAWGGDTANAVVGSNGEAKFIFRVGMQPGNNYRVVASLLDSSGYTGVQTANPTSPKYLGPAASQNAGTHASQLLTVWRRLWVENDSMNAIPVDSYGYKKNNLTPNVDPATINTISLKSDGNTSFGLPFILDDSSFVNLENGHIVIQSVSYPVLETGWDSFEVTVSGDRTSIPDHSEFRLYDDDGFGLNHEPLPRNDLVDDVFKSVYKCAFIEAIDANEFNAQKIVNFARSRPPVVGRFIDPKHYGVWDDALDSNLEGGENLWAATVVTGYQPSLELDNDPNSEANSLMGVTVGDSWIFNGNARLSIVFSEVIRDMLDDEFRIGETGNFEYERRLRLTAAHEIGHQPLYGLGNAQHNEDGLMQDGGHLSMGGEVTQFSAKSVKRFRSVFKWRQKE